VEVLSDWHFIKHETTLVIFTRHFLQKVLDCTENTGNDTCSHVNVLMGDCKVWLDRGKNNVWRRMWYIRPHLRIDRTNTLYSKLHSGFRILFTVSSNCWQPLDLKRDDWFTGSLSKSQIFFNFFASYFFLSS
jgi:hypothetical protein